MTITLTNEESEEYFFNAICNGLAYVQSYGLQLSFKKEHYKQAQSKLTSPCLEDVLMQMLRDGNTFGFVDEESDGEYSKQITLKDVHEGMKNVPPDRILEMANENDDADTADAIIQSVFYGEIIFC
jgi:hypothetical protein